LETALVLPIAARTSTWLKFEIDIEQMLTPPEVEP